MFSLTGEVKNSKSLPLELEISPEILNDQVSFLRTNPFLSTFETRRERGCASLQPHHSFTLKTIDVFTFTMNLNDR